MNLRFSLGTLVVLAASLMATSCGGKEGKARSEFVAGCTSQGAPKSQCKCLYDKLQDKYGVETMAAMRQERVVPADFGETMISSAQQCSTEVG
jgi:hypothetical protein